MQTGMLSETLQDAGIYTHHVLLAIPPSLLLSGSIVQGKVDPSMGTVIYGLLSCPD